MATRTINYIKLGFFVLAGLVFMVVLLYFIGRNKSIFNPSFIAYARFENIHGLLPGNNVRFSGIQVGSVKKIKIISDTVIEVSLSIDKNYKNIIRKNAEVSIATDGFVGNKIVNITPVKSPAGLIEDLDYLPSKRSIDTDGMLSTLNRTNNNVAILSEELKNLVLKFNQNKDLMALISSDEIPVKVRSSLQHLQQASGQLQHTAGVIQQIVDSVEQGKGSIGAVLEDTLLYSNLISASEQIKKFGDDATRLSAEAKQVMHSISSDIRNRNGPVQALIRDSSMTESIQQSLNNIEQGTARFNQNMEALKSNFLVRGYFKKLAKKDSLAKKNK